VSNIGTITTLTNSGQIAGGDGGSGFFGGAGGAGVSNVGTITTLTNTGQIDGGDSNISNNSGSPAFVGGRGGRSLR